MKYCLTLFTILCIYTLNAQSVFNAQLIRKLEGADSNEIIHVLVLTKPHTDINFSEFKGMELLYSAGNIYSVRAPVASVKALASVKNILRVEFMQHQLKLMGDTCVIKNRIKNIKLGLSPLTQSYDGTGVIVGIIDSGTDFNHPDFKDANGKSRIKFLWDMTKPSVNSPTPFNYGQEWNNTQIDLGQCTHDDLAYYGHGTASSGIAAGNGFAINKYEGMAPKADLIIVALDFSRQGFTISDALQYIITKSQLLNKPVVVNASLGDYYGSHDGTDLETQIMNNLITNAPGRALVAACGNSGSTPFHVGYTIAGTDTSFTWLKNSGSVFIVDEYADTAQIKNVKYSIGVTNPGFTDLGSTHFKPYNYALGTLKRDTIYHNLNKIGIIESIASINTFGVYELSVKIKTDSIGYLWSISHCGTGRIDSWNFDYVKGSLPAASTYPKIIHYKKVDSIQTIVSGFQCSDEVITVANYINRNQFKDVNNTLQISNAVPGQLHATSSIGPTRDNRIKPDISATGATILAASPLNWLSYLSVNAPQVVAYGGYYVTAEGTSAASPVVAGLAALYFQKNPTATNRQVKQAIINCAYHDVFTTTALPNSKWGYGKLDGFATMTCGDVQSGINYLQDVNDGIKLFPHPLVSETTITFKDEEIKNIKLYNSSGQLLLLDKCKSSTYILKRNDLAAGLYFLISEEKNMTHKIKIVIL